MGSWCEAVRELINDRYVLPDKFHGFFQYVVSRLNALLDLVNVNHEMSASSLTIPLSP